MIGGNHEPDSEITDEDEDDIDSLTSSSEVPSKTCPPSATSENTDELNNAEEPDYSDSENANKPQEGTVHSFAQSESSNSIDLTEESEVNDLPFYSESTSSNYAFRRPHETSRF